MKGLVIVTAVFSLGGCGSSDPTSGTGDAVCAAPMTLVADTAIRPGQDLRISADGMWSDCYDQGQGGTPPPLTRQEVVFTHGGTEVELATVDAGADGTVELTVTVPLDAAPGDAEIAIGRALPAAVTVVGG